MIVSLVTIEESPHRGRWVEKDMGRTLDATDVHVGQRIKMRRMMLRMSQSDLAKPCGITFQQVQKYENGKNRVGASRLQQFSKLLDAPVSFFFEGLAPPGAKRKDAFPDLAQELMTTRDGLALAKAFTSIEKPPLRRAIVHIVEEFAKR
jgi:transcriptional regulator with XRE-family HTH domain